MAEKNPFILVPTDFTSTADTAINHAAKLASVTGDEIRLLHVVNKDTKSKLKKAGESLDDLNAKMDAQVQQVKSTYNVKADSHLREGSIFTTIGEVAEEIGAKLIVMGTHGVIGMQHITGAWAVKVITSSPVPVIVVQKKNIADHGYKTIVFPIDSSRETKQKVIHTISIAKDFGSMVHLFASHETDEFLINARNNNIAWAENMFKKNGVEYKLAQADGNHAKQTIKYASQVGADLITILTDDSDVSVSGFVLGPDHEKVINNDAQIATMCVNPVANLYNIGNVLFL
ncbi:MAG: universal stress protein [Flavobacteriales bacterium]|nr:universal stress protein [Flavobacteriales bacterium]